MVIRLKVCILGEPGVGKTSLILRYVKNFFNSDYKPTLGADFLQKIITVDELPELGTDKIELVIWDIAGQTSYEVDKMTDYYLTSAAGYILVYDLNQQQNLEKMRIWKEKIEKVCGNIPYIVVGNKLDLVEKSDMENIVEDEIKENFQTLILQSSAKTGEHVSDIFIELVKRIGI